MIQYEEGTLVIDMIDARTNQLVWRGMVKDTILDFHNINEVDETVVKNVSELLAEFPPHR